MSVPNYGLLKGNVDRFKDTSSSNHCQIVIQTGTTAKDCYRIAVNVRSSDAGSPDLLYYIANDFHHPITAILENMPKGKTRLPKGTPNAGRLDYIRGNLFPIDQMKVIPTTQPGPDNDLVDKVTQLVTSAKNRRADVYALGDIWPPTTAKDKYFADISDQGIHDIHMNQGNPNPGSHKNDNGVWQDGGLLFHFKDNGSWVALFLRFQSQAIHTDDTTGHPIADVHDAPLDVSNPNTPEFNNPIYILAVLANPKPSNDAGNEKVLLFNPNDVAVNIEGWSLADKMDRKDTLKGTLGSGAALVVTLTGTNALLGNDGGTITLLNKQGLKVHGVAYTAAQASKSGKWIVY